MRPGALRGIAALRAVALTALLSGMGLLLWVPREAVRLPARQPDSPAAAVASPGERAPGRPRRGERGAVRIE
jgi:hypothetical protein